jgi:hypothetical protein
MNRTVAALAMVLIGVVPFWINPTWVVAVFAIGASIFCAAGLLWRMLSATLVGCVFALINLAIALWLTGASLSVLSAVAFGVAQLLLLESTHFAAQFAAAEVDRAVSRGQMAWWISRSALCVAAAFFLVVLASALATVLPPYGRPIIAAVGALLAFAAALRMVLST